jgi:hypothetical protein
VRHVRRCAERETSGHGVKQVREVLHVQIILLQFCRSALICFFSAWQAERLSIGSAADG